MNDKTIRLLLAIALFKNKRETLPATGDNFRITHHLDFHCKINYIVHTIVYNTKYYISK